MDFKETMFEGYPCVQFGNEEITLWVTTSIGPRILGCSYRGGENLFAQVPDDEFTHPDGESYYVRGGHRLWYAPEVAATTYTPDNHPVEIIELEDGLKVVQEVEANTGIRKSIKISFSQLGNQVIVDHTLTNEGEADIELAPWSITQMRPGGVGIFPQETRIKDPQGFWPNRMVALWPYSEMKSPYVDWGDEFIFIRAEMIDEKFKMGSPNPKGWLGYLWQNTLFIKYAKYSAESQYFDFNTSSQIYCDWRFLELETLGPRTILAPGENVNHCEHWEIFGDIELDISQSGAQKLIKSLSLEDRRIS